MKEKNMKTVTKELENRNPNNKNSLVHSAVRNGRRCVSERTLCEAAFCGP